MAISKSGELSHTKSFDVFDVLAVKEVYAPKRKQGESELQLHDQSASYSRRVLPAFVAHRVRDPIRVGAAKR